MTGGERLVVALVRGVHGLQGAVRVEVLTDRPEERFRPGAVLFREGSDEPLTVASGGAVSDGPGWRLRFAEVPNRTAAERLRGAYLAADARTSEPLPRGHYYWHEVVGSSVRDLNDRELGVVEDVYRAGDAEVFVVRGGPFGEFDVPAVRAVVRIFAPKRREIVVDTDALGLEEPRPARRRGSAESRGEAG
ncbi:MAG: 16S rRNA processing protein RimM [Chloroflexi bacterium]|nr:MAG: 16S rRNA processing protein RimM [Chloroflexota bacterium]